VILYQCFEAAAYIDKETGKDLNPREAWERTTREYFDTKKRPIVKYNFKDDSVEVKPIHFQNVKILWKP